MIKRKVFHKPNLAEYGKPPGVATSIKEANLIGSETVGGMHAPVLDLDFPARLIPSSTPGHFHLYLDKEIPWEKYQKVLEAMAEAELIEPGYMTASKAQGGTFVRPPWIKKGDDRSVAQKRREQKTLRELVLGD